jgi:hypothetical protein
MSDINNLKNQLLETTNPENEVAQTETDEDESDSGQDQNSHAALTGKVEKDRSEDNGDKGQLEITKEQTQEFVYKNTESQPKDNNNRMGYKDRDPVDMVSSSSSSSSSNLASFGGNVQRNQLPAWNGGFDTQSFISRTPGMQELLQMELGRQAMLNAMCMGNVNAAQLGLISQTNWWISWSRTTNWWIIW